MRATPIVAGTNMVLHEKQRSHCAEKDEEEERVKEDTAVSDLIAQDEVPEWFIDQIRKDRPEHARQDDASVVEPIGEKVPDHETGQQVKQKKHTLSVC